MRIGTQSQISVRPELAELVKNLKVGDSVKGRLMEFLDNSVTIKTSTGQTLTATLPNNLQFMKGDIVELLVNKITQENIFAEIKMDGKSSQKGETKLSEMLSKFEIPINEKSLEAVKLLIKHNLPVNKEDINQVINMQKSAEGLKESSPEGKLALMLTGADIKNTEINILNKTALINEGQVKNIIEQNGQKIQNTNNDENNVNIKEVIEQIKQTMNNKEGTNNIKSEIRTSKTEKQVVELLNKLDISIDNKTKNFIKDIAKSLDIASSSKLEEIVYLKSKDMDITPKNIQQLKNNINNDNKLSSFIEKLSIQIENKEELQNINVQKLQTTGIKQTKEEVEEKIIDLKTGIKNLKEIKQEIRKLFVEPKQVESKEEIKEKLQSIVKLGEKLESILNKENINDTEIKSTLTNLRDNIDFIKQVNQFNNYMQLPVMVNGQNSTVEMYVFRDKKNSKSIDPSNATILIALDLKYLGHLESLISVAKKSVDVTFRLEDEKAGELLKAQAKQLLQSLEAKGYSLNPIKIIKLEQTFNLITLDEVMYEKNAEQLHFDARI